MQPHLNQVALGAMSDAELVARARERDQHALATLLSRYHRSVFSTAYRSVHNRDDAEDIAQASFVKLALHLHDYDESKPLGVWLHTIVNHCIVDFVRRSQRHRHVQLDTDDVRALSDHHTPEEEMENRETIASVQNAMRCLDPEQKRALRLRTIDGESIESLAMKMNVPVTTVRWYLLRAKQKLRSEIRRQQHREQLSGLMKHR